MKKNSCNIIFCVIQWYQNNKNKQVAVVYVIIRVAWE